MSRNFEPPIGRTRPVKKVSFASTAQVRIIQSPPPRLQNDDRLPISTLGPSVPRNHSTMIDQQSDDVQAYKDDGTTGEIGASIMECRPALGIVETAGGAGEAGDDVQVGLDPDSDLDLDLDSEPEIQVQLDEEIIERIAARILSIDSNYRAAQISLDLIDEIITPSSSDVDARPDQDQDQIAKLQYLKDGTTQITWEIEAEARKQAIEEERIRILTERLGRADEWWNARLKAFGNVLEALTDSMSGDTLPDPEALSSIFGVRLPDFDPDAPIDFDKSPGSSIFGSNDDEDVMYTGIPDFSLPIVDLDMGHSDLNELAAKIRDLTSGITALGAEQRGKVG